MTTTIRKFKVLHYSTLIALSLAIALPTHTMQKVPNEIEVKPYTVLIKIKNRQLSSMPIELACRKEDDGNYYYSINNLKKTTLKVLAKHSIIVPREDELNILLPKNVEAKDLVPASSLNTLQVELPEYLLLLRHINSQYYYSYYHESLTGKEIKKAVVKCFPALFADIKIMMGGRIIDNNERYTYKDLRGLECLHLIVSKQVVPQ